MSYAALAQQAGWTEGRVIRRVEALREAGILYFDVDLAIGLLGFRATAYLWLIVEPARLAAVGEQISRHAEVPFAAAITGSGQPGRQRRMPGLRGALPVRDDQDQRGGRGPAAGDLPGAEPGQAGRVADGRPAPGHAPAR